MYKPSPSQRPYDVLLYTWSSGALGTAHSGTAASSPLAECSATPSTVHGSYADLFNRREKEGTYR